MKFNLVPQKLHKCKKKWASYWTSRHELLLALTSWCQKSEYFRTRAKKQIVDKDGLSFLVMAEEGFGKRMTLDRKMEARGVTLVSGICSISPCPGPR